MLMGSDLLSPEKGVWGENEEFFNDPLRLGKKPHAP
jgi:hypothetical protein